MIREENREKTEKGEKGDNSLSSAFCLLRLSVFSVFCLLRLSVFSAFSGFCLLRLSVSASLVCVCSFGVRLDGAPVRPSSPNIFVTIYGLIFWAV